MPSRSSCARPARPARSRHRCVRRSGRSIRRSLSKLASVPMAERFRLPGLQPERAPTIVAGVVILVQVMRAFGLDEIEVSEHDILHGAALEAAARPAAAR